MISHIYRWSYILKKMFHKNCRNGYYPRNNINRCIVPDDKVTWDISYSSYSPPQFTAASILALPTYADPLITAKNFKPNWNNLDGKTDRRSHEGPYDIVDDYPRNYKGRTGLKGRGCLGKWGPNHAADPIVTRWKTDKNIEREIGKSGYPILQFVSIQRRDNGEWAIPGGMVDPGECVSSTLKREFMEEALNSLSYTDKQKQNIQEKLETLFGSGKEIYKGYVDDPRNTDNAWMETVAVNFHEEELDGLLSRMKLEAGDDAKNVTWIDINKDINLYANHAHILEKVATDKNADW